MPGAGGGRRPIVGGNWKMHTTRAEARALLAALVERLTPPRGVEPPPVDIVVFPPAPWLGDAADALGGGPIAVGVQDIHPEPSGAFTGAVSAQMLRGVATWALVGHSERRRLFGDADALVAEKLRAAIASGLHPVLAVGESLGERDRGETARVLEGQLTAACEGLVALPDDLVIAYEPVWAIGSGRTATPAEAQEGCAHVRAVLAARFGEAPAERCRIQYGGSVDAENAAALLAQPDIDGLLVGGASLDADAFMAICRAAATGGR